MRQNVVAALLIALVACSAGSAEQRLRNYFAIPPAVPSDTLSLGAAILHELKAGTAERDVASRLKAQGVGSDSLSAYYPPTSTDTGLVRVEYDPQNPNVVAKSYAVRLVFDSTRKLSTVRVTQWLTGP